MGRGKAEGGVIGRPQVDSLYGVDLPCIGDRTDNSEIYLFPTGHKEVVVRADAVAVRVVLHAMAAVGLDPLEVALGQVNAGELSLFSVPYGYRRSSPLPGGIFRLAAGLV